jgi:hypothetical protein
MSPVLHKMTVPVISNNDCKITFGDNITDDIMCTNGANNMGTCIVSKRIPIIKWINF